MRAATRSGVTLETRAELRRLLAGRGMCGAEAERAAARALCRLRRRVGARCADLLGAAQLAEFARLRTGHERRSWLLGRLPSVPDIVREEFVIVSAALTCEAPPALVNLTEHSVMIRLGSEVTVHIPPSGRVARCYAEPDRVLHTVQVDGHHVPVVLNHITSRVSGLPEPEDGVLFVVSRLVAMAAPQRRDVVFPHRPVRDDAGRTAACRVLAQVPPPA